jgi:hypothetical protein
MTIDHGALVRAPWGYAWARRQRQQQEAHLVNLDDRQQPLCGAESLTGHRFMLSLVAGGYFAKPCDACQKLELEKQV